jgi:hypothetical protein
MLALLAQLPCEIWGSLGDRDPKYRKCVDSSKKVCRGHTSNESLFSFYPISIVNWSCIETAQYACMRTINAERLQNKEPALKYYGHWCFERYFGLEEPASVLFSLLNLVPHLLYLQKQYLQKVNGQNTHAKWLTCLALVASNAWLASAYFHSKKTPHASTYDYISALLFISFGLILAIRRVLLMKYPKLVYSVCLVGLVLCMRRIRGMIAGRVSFDDHMYLCIGTVALTGVLYTIWVFYSVYLKWVCASKQSLSNRWFCLFCQLWLGVASSLELFDFPAIWGIYDAHSLWHAATVPLGFLWYRFWSRDAAELAILAEKSSLD